jgi:hypothetical protein
LVVGQDIGRWFVLAVLACSGCRERAVEAASATSNPPTVAKALAPAATRTPLALELIDDFNPSRPSAGASDRPAPTAAWDGALGGLSGLFYSASEGLLYAITDDRGRFPARLYTFEVELGEHALRVEPRSVVPLHEPTPTSSLIEMDAEGITGNDRTLFLSVEGNAEPPHQRESRILRLQRDGLVTGQLSVPAAYRPAPSGEPPRGTRPNQGFEGLSVSPSGRYLVVSAEEALFQDGDPSTFDAGSLARLARWDLERGGEPTEYFYRTDPIVPRVEAPSVAATGVSEIVALDDTRLLLLERAFVKDAQRAVNTIRIFEADVTLASNAAGGSALPVVPKRLVLDLGEVVARFDEGQRELDNFEGMTLGPRLPSGNPSLLLVSDDNFSARQRTVFVALELSAREQTAP